jgi:hypothetical protein
MPQTVNEILAGRDVICYTEPFLTANTFPADSAWGTSPGGSWVDQGWTKDGVAVRWRQQIQEYMVDQSLDPVVVIPLSRDLRFVATLGQVDMPALVVMTSTGTATGVASTASGTADFILTSAVSNQYFSIFFDIRNPATNDFAHFVGWRTRGVGDVDLHVHLADLPQMNMEMRALPDTSVSPARVAQLRMQLG